MTLKIIFTLFIWAAFVLPAHALPEKVVNPGCTFSWFEPTEDDGQGVQVGSWEKAGDLAGFTWMTNSTQVWEIEKEQDFPDKTLREITCEQVAVMEPGEYWVGIRAYDDSKNASLTAWLNVGIVLADTTPPAMIIRLCLNGLILGETAKLCAITEAPSP